MRSKKEKPLPSGKGNGLNEKQRTKNSMSKNSCQEVETRHVRREENVKTEKCVGWYPPDKRKKRRKKVGSPLETCLYTLESAYTFFDYYSQQKLDVQDAMTPEKDLTLEMMQRVLVAHGRL